MSVAPHLALALDDRIKTLAALVSLVLVLITLFTSQRTDVLRGLWKDGGEKSDGIQEALLAAGLIVATILLFLAGLPLWLDTLKNLHPLADSGPLRSTFAVVWPLLLALLIWQIVLLVSAIKFWQSTS